MSTPDAEITADSSPSANFQGRRSYVLELIGAVSVIGFFVGIYFAYQTQVSGVVTQREFDQLQPGQSLATVNKLLGFEGALLDPSPDQSAHDHTTASSPATTFYVWENSTVSFVQCTFVEGRLTEKKALDLP